MNKEYRASSIIISTICWFCIIGFSLLVIDEHTRSHHIYISLLLLFMQCLVIFLSAKACFNLVYRTHQPINQRIITAFAISIFFVCLMNSLNKKTSGVISETQMIESTFVDRSNMSCAEKIKFIDELRPHFREAVRGAIRSGDCYNVDDFLNHLQIANLSKGMTYSQKIGTVATNYVLSYCKRRR